VGTIKRKGSDNLAKSSATVVNQSHLGQAPNETLLIIQQAEALLAGKEYQDIFHSCHEIALLGV